MHPMVNFSLRALREVGKSFLRAQQVIVSRPFDAEEGANYVAMINQNIYTSLVKLFGPSYREHTFYHIDSCPDAGDFPEQCWIFTPLIGADNFLRGGPDYCIQLTFYKHDEAECTIIYEPATDNFACAIRGGGAQANGGRARITAIRNPEEALIDFYATGHPSIAEALVHAPFSPERLRLRGNAVLAAVGLACRYTDAAILCGTNGIDIEGLKLLTKESGGVARNIAGKGTLLTNLKLAEALEQYFPYE